MPDSWAFALAPTGPQVPSHCPQQQNCALSQWESWLWTVHPILPHVVCFNENVNSHRTHGRPNEHVGTPRHEHKTVVSLARGASVVLQGLQVAVTSSALMVWNPIDVLLGKGGRGNNSGCFDLVLSVECGPEEVFFYFTENFSTEIQDSVFPGGFSVADFVGPDGSTPTRHTKDSPSTAEGSRPGALDVLCGSYHQFQDE